MRFIKYLFFCVTLVSCQKYLDKKPDATLAVPTTLDDMQALLDDGIRMNERSTPSANETFADDYFLTDDVYQSLSDNQRPPYTWDMSESTFTNDWSRGYTCIFISNFCLEGLPKIERTTLNGDTWDNVKGSAHFFRAYYYLHLLWQHAKVYDPATASTDLGIVLREGTDMQVPSVRSSVADGYRQVISDLHTAMPLLPQHPLVIFRPSRRAAQAFLARVYLSTRQYDSAYHYANLCLSQNDILLDYNTISLSSRTPFTRDNNPELIFYSELNNNVNLHGPTNATIDTLLYRSYATNDLRRRAYFTAKGSYFLFKGMYTGNRNIFFSGLATDEVLLIRAECHARASRLSDAMNDLNRLLQHRYNASFIPLSASTAAEALNLVLQERRKELLMRGLRFIDLKRLNADGAGLVVRRLINGQSFELPPNDSRYQMKLPKDIIELTGMPQN